MSFGVSGFLPTHFFKTQGRPTIKAIVNRFLMPIVLGVVVAVCLFAPSRAAASDPVSGFVYTGLSGSAETRTFINGYSVDGSTGGLTPIPSTPFAAGGNVLAIAVHPSGNFLYVANSNSNVGQISAFTVDSLTGGLTPIAGSPISLGVALDGAGSSMLAITANGKFLYLANKVTGMVKAFSVDTTTGALTLMSGSASGYALAVNPTGTYLYAYDAYVNRSTFVYSIDQTSGELTQVQVIAGCGFTQMAVDPSGHFLYGAGSGIRACQIDATTGMLSVVSGSPFAANQTFTDLAVHPSGTFLFAVKEGFYPNKVVFGYTIDAVTGALVAMQNSPFSPPGTGYGYLEAVAPEPHGKYVYVTDGTYGVAGFSADPVTGELTIASNSFTGAGAETLALIAAHSSSSPTPISLTLSPSSEDLVTSTLSKKVQFVLSGTFSDGSTQFLTDSASWASTNTAIGTVASGLVTAKAYGMTIITASFGGLSASAQMTVEAPPLESITVAPAIANIHAGTGIAFTATGYYGDGSTKYLTHSASWQSSDTSVVTIDSTGLAVGSKQGSVTIAASYEGVSGTATLNVLPAKALSTRFGHFLYSSSPGAVINGFSIDGATGALSALPATTIAAGGTVAAIAIHPSGNFLYVTTVVGSTGELSAFTVDALTGGLTPITGFPISLGITGQTRLAITPNGEFMYLSDGYHGTTTAYSVDGTSGAVSLISGSTVQGFYAAINPAGTFLYVNGSNVYSINQTSGKLTKVQTVAACGANQMVIDPSGHYLYGTADGVVACQIDGTTGKLTAVPGSPFGYTVDSLAIHPSGSFLFSSWSQSSPFKLYGYAIDASTGALVPMQNSPFALAAQPAFEPHGKYAFGADSAGLSTYAVNPATGALTRVSSCSALSLGTGNLTVLGSSQLWDPKLQWSTPSAITYGTALSGTQLDATASVPGTFDYAPAAGTVLGAGNHTLSVNFTPVDSAEFSAQSTSVTLTVNKATPTISWSNPAAITYGTALSATQLDATASVLGTFVYAPGAGAVLNAGQKTLNVTFTPTDTANYTTASGSVTLQVNQATPTVTWSTPAAITYGTALGATQLDATASVPGKFAYSPAAGTVLSAGTQTLSVTFTPTDGTDYKTVTTSVTLQVNPAASTITWSTPAAITYGTALGATQLDATASVPGTFVYTPAAGTYPRAGNKTLKVTFTPTDSTDYKPASATVTIVVNQATPAINWPYPSYIVYGTALSSTQLDASSTVAGTFAYTPGAGTVLDAGAHSLSVTLTPTDTIDYTTATASVNLNVTKAAPAITWATPAAITYGTALSATQLDATASVPGTMSYSETAGTYPAAGHDTITATFTPTDTANYKTVTKSVILVVNPATPPALTSPAPGGTLAGASVTFGWSAGVGPVAYQLKLGTTGPGASDVYLGGSTTATGVTVSNIPMNGATLYARLNYKIAGTWQTLDYTYTQAGTPTPPVLTSPAPGGTLTGASATFAWSAGAGPTNYQLKLGTTGAGSSDVYLGGSITSTSVPVSGIPTNGVKLYARLLYKVNGVWKYTDYTYTEGTAPSVVE